MTGISARQAILDRVRAATRDDSNAYPDLPRSYVRHGALDLSARVRLMTERLKEYGADVVECLPEDLPGTIAHQLTSSGRHTFVAPTALPALWRDAGFSWKVDNDLSYEAIESCEGVLTASSAGIADSGTIVLHHGETEGRRVITLLPDFHLCILRATQIVETLPEYFARCSEPPRLATYISGPSATADIEMTRIKGVHGPRFLSVIIVRDNG
ncbi:LUD domain-containing protein [Telmatobacter sp. DSM 110680]|uniref:LUD domain-containing protein n=1 Tax=Telmatobacter sp. DSM 110680 TaxID=3036704 RepID=A0AAU7DEQ5_9BACT